MITYVVIRSNLIDTIEEAWAYYRERFVGPRSIQVGGCTIMLHFPGDEIHLFTEKLKVGQDPSPDKLVRRPGSNEVRYFSKSRARLLDRVVPTLEKPAGSVAAKEAGATMVFGPVDKDGHRLAVVVRPRGERWNVRTAYPLTPKEFADYKRGGSRSMRWPP